MMELLFVLTGLLGGNAGDLADYTPTDLYWQMQDQRIVDAQTMSAVLDDDDASAVDRLMAIRALGEVGKAEGADKQAVLKVLTPLVDSKEPFVGQYAKRSIAWVKGEDPPALAMPTSAQLEQDLALLPASSILVGQLKVQPGNEPIDLASMMPDLGAVGGPNALSKEELARQAGEALVKALGMIGNARLDAVSLGLTFTGTGDDGYAMVVGRGQYDRIGVQIAFEQMAQEQGEDAFNFYSIGQVEVITIDNRGMQLAMMMPSDELFIFMFGEPGPEGLGAYPLAATAERFADPDRKPSFNEKVAAQVQQIDRDKADVWLAMQPSGPMTTEMGEVFGAFDAGHAYGVRGEDGIMDVSWRAEGQDPAKVQETVTFIREGVKEGVTEMEQMMQQMPQMKQMFEPMVTMMKSIKVEQDGAVMTGGMKLDGSSWMSPFLGLGRGL